MGSVTRPKADFSDRRFRLLVSLCVGAIAAAYCLASMKATNGARVADDFTWHWLGARALLSGQNPYVVVVAGGKYDLIAPYIYPLTTAIAVIPFSAFLSPVVAATAFIGVSSAFLAWGLTSEGYQRLPLFISLPFVWAASAGQFSPILAAAALIPSLGWLAPIKPTIGLATLAYRPSRIAVIGSAAFIAATFAVNPHWFVEWRSALQQRVSDAYWIPMSIVGGPLLLLTCTRWRRREARLLGVLSVVPQLFLFYDQLLLWLIPKTWKESLLLSVLSWIALFIGNRSLSPMPTTHDVVAAYAPAIMALMFLPSLVMILRRANETGHGDHMSNTSPKEMERTGIEPATSWLQTRRSPS